MIMIWLLMTALMTLFGVIRVQSPYLRLFHEGESATAKVLELSPDDHNTFKYGFSVDKVEYLGSGKISELKENRVGAVIPIVYAKSNPTLSAMCDSRAMASERFLSLIAATVAVSSIYAALVVLLASKKMKKNRPDTQPQAADL